MIAMRWDDFAAREPWYAVLPDRAYLRAKFDDAAKERFFATGEAYVTCVLHTIRERVAPALHVRRVLEFGCGPGRLAIPFARRGFDVTAVDRAPAMIETAKREASDLPIRFLTALDDGTFDLVNACLVFQRMRPREGLRVLRELAGRIESGGVGVFHFQYRRAMSPLQAFVRRTIPGFNAAVNALKHRELNEPLFDHHVYDMNEVLAVLADAGAKPAHVDVDGDSLTVYVLRGVAGDLHDDHALPDDPSRIDVRQLIASASMEDLHRRAEAYFANLADREPHLAKPFANVADTPNLLINIATLLQGLHLAPGQSVLDFGAGTGWLSRMLTQLGCRAILLDVSPAALDIARELYTRMPVIGARPEPQFLPFDGHRIDLPDGSVDRIICFDAFHHAINPEEVLREFARVLVPGGIAAFAEPGPHHSKSPQSQFEMRVYGVVENDIDLHAIEAMARRAGFAELRVAAFNAYPFHVSVAEFDDLLRRGETYARWANTTREFMRDVRDFFLIREGAVALDSRYTEALACVIDARAEGRRLFVTVTNSGSGRWLPAHEQPGGVCIGAHLYDASGMLIAFDFHWQPLPGLAPGETMSLDYDIPPLEPGTYDLELDCVAQNVAWFAQRGSKPARVRITA